MAEVGAQRQIMLHNLATHAARARDRLRLSLPDAARLADLTPESPRGHRERPQLHVIARRAHALGSVPRSDRVGRTTASAAWDAVATCLDASAPSEETPEPKIRKAYMRSAQAS